MATAHVRASLRGIAASLERRPSSLAIDLMNIAAAVYAADRTETRGRSWQRRMHVNVGLSDSRRWQRSAQELASALVASTDDAWKLEFLPHRALPPEEMQGWLLKVQPRSITSVALFSGGLDSFAGASVWLNEHQGEVLGLLSVRSSTVVGSVQRQSFDLLHRHCGDRVVALSIPLGLAHAGDIERSQRSRGFVYAALATAAAECAEVSQVLIFENGYGSLNPRLLEHQEGAQTTKSTHPYALRLMQRSFQSAGFGVQISLPYGNCTKAELLARIPADLRHGISVTASCDAFPLRRKEAKQCGYCGSCVLRQQSIRSAGLKEFDRVDYAELPFETGRRSDNLLLMACQARQFIETASRITVADAVRRWPEISLGEGSAPSFVLIERLNLLRRYGLEWQSLIQSHPALATILRWQVAA